MACNIGNRLRIVERAVLDVDGDEVVALRGHDLRGEGVSDRAPTVDRRLALGPELLELVRDHVQNTTCASFTSR